MRLRDHLSHGDVSKVGYFFDSPASFVCAQNIAAIETTAIHGRFD